jgi:hypothetical protein
MPWLQGPRVLLNQLDALESYSEQSELDLREEIRLYEADQLFKHHHTPHVVNIVTWLYRTTLWTKNDDDDPTTTATTATTTSTDKDLDLKGLTAAIDMRWVLPRRVTFHAARPPRKLPVFRPLVFPLRQQPVSQFILSSSCLTWLASRMAKSETMSDEQYSNLHVMLALAAPIVPYSTRHLQRSRAKFNANLRGLLARDDQDPQFRLNCLSSNFVTTTLDYYNVYHGINERPSKTATAELYRRFCPDLLIQPPHIAQEVAALPPLEHKRLVDAANPLAINRLRVGFVSRFFFHGHSINKVVYGLINAFDRHMFEVTVFYFHDARDSMDSFHVDLKLELPTDIHLARLAILRCQLDVVVFTDVGLDPITYFMSAVKLATLQIGTWTHPVTSGWSSFDYFVSVADERRRVPSVRNQATLVHQYQQELLANLSTEAHQHHLAAQAHKMMSPVTHLSTLVNLTTTSPDAPSPSLDAWTSGATRSPVQRAIAAMHQQVFGAAAAIDPDAFNLFPPNPSDWHEVELMDAPQTRHASCADDEHGETCPWRSVDHMYSEGQVIHLRGPYAYVTPHPSPPHPSEHPRASFGLPAEGERWLDLPGQPVKVLIGCPQELFKFNPRFDWVLRTVMHHNPTAILVLIEGQHPRWNTIVLNRLQLPATRVKIIPKLSQSRFLALMSALDLFLDPFPFGGGITAMEAMACYVPIVTLETNALSALMATHFYRVMGFTDLIAPSIDRYITIASDMIRSAARRATAKHRMMVGARHLLANRENVYEWQRLLIRLAQRHGILAYRLNFSSADDAAFEAHAVVEATTPPRPPAPRDPDQDDDAGADPNPDTQPSKTSVSGWGTR